MEKINKIRDLIDAYRIYVEDKTGRISDDYQLPPRLIYFMFQNIRNTVVFDDNKNKAAHNDDYSLILTLPCIELREIDVIESPALPSKGCTFYKSTHPLPKMLGGLPLSVTSADGIVHYDYVLWSQFKEKISSRIEAQNREPKYTFRVIDKENHLYCYSSDKISDPKAVAITAYPKDPLEFYQFPTCGKEFEVLCNPMDEELLVEDELVYKIFDIMLGSIAKSRQLATGADTFNNDNNDTQAQVKR